MGKVNECADVAQLNVNGSGFQLHIQSQAEQKEGSRQKGYVHIVILWNVVAMQKIGLPNQSCQGKQKTDAGKGQLDTEFVSGKANTYQDEYRGHEHTVAGGFEERLIDGE